MVYYPIKVFRKGADGLNSGWYEVAALAARYVFAALGAYIVLMAWRSHRLAQKESASYRGEGSYIGELRVVGDVTGRLDGKTYPLPMEGCIGSSRACDVRIKCKGLKRKHVYFEQREGCLLLTPMGGGSFEILPKRKVSTLLYDGDRLKMGGLLLVMAFYDAEDVSRPEG